jgi:hypothetical protein
MRHKVMKTPKNLLIGDAALLPCLKVAQQLPRQSVLNGGARPGLLRSLDRAGRSARRPIFISQVVARPEFP